MATVRQQVPGVQIASSMRGFTLVELMIVILGLAILSYIVMGEYGKYMDRARYSQAGADIRMIETAIIKFYTQQSRYPDDLSEVYPGGIPQDPWKQAYQYGLLELAAGNCVSPCRVDGNMKPLNSDFDLYSKGKDTKTAKQVTSPYGRDDMIRTRNGSTIAKGEKL